MYENNYLCPDCGHAWSDRHEAQPDDDCPACGSRKISPHDSTALAAATAAAVDAPSIESAADLLQLVRDQDDYIGELIASLIDEHDGNATEADFPKGMDLRRQAAELLAKLA